MNFDYINNPPICFVFALGLEVSPLIEHSQVLRTWRKGKSRHWEAMCNGIPVRIVRTGIGPNRAKIALQDLDYKPAIIINSGSAGALSPDLRVGHMVIPNQTVGLANKGRPLQCDGDLAERLSQAGLERGHKPRLKPLVTSDKPIFLTKERMDIHERTNCWAVDMEAYAIAEVARHIGARFACLKVISDSLSHSKLPGKPSKKETLRKPWKIPLALWDIAHWSLFIRSFKRSLNLLPPILMGFLDSMDKI